jgi:glutamate-ammonia-ligase adenylyltransferase
MPGTASDRLSAHLARAQARLAAAGVALPAAADDTAAIRRLLLASDFAVDTLCRQPMLLVDPAAAPLPPPELDPLAPAQWPAQLRRWRAAESTRLIWRDVSGRDDVADTLAGSSRIAEQALAVALHALQRQFAERHGLLRDSRGEPQRLVVFGLGKLGGGELNFSSDIDLIYAFREHGDSDGARPLDAETYFTRIGQRLAQLLGDVTADGFCHRVDLRLRPFGNAGRVALSFAAMEQYYQRDGRDWERYAWIKARPVAGDIAAGEELLAALRPFVYRRYLDYTALDGLREMKALIDAEVQKRELADHLKLGPGGIREIEFLVQAMQLIRGGREAELRQRALLPALQALVAGGHLPPAHGEALRAAYLFLRRLENRVQMFGDQQTHALPEDPALRERIALGLGYGDTPAMTQALDAHREAVNAAFADLLQSRRRRLQPNALGRYWRGLPDAGDAAVLLDAGFAEAEQHHQRLRDFARSPAVRDLSERARQRLDHVMPALIEAAAHSAAPDAALPRGLGLLQAIGRRPSYLALLEEQPAALPRLIDVVSRSALLSERLAAHPVLLDELLDARALGPAPTLAGVRVQIETMISRLDWCDTEAALLHLNEARQSLAFRIALAALAQRQPAAASAAQLAALAECMLQAALRLARAEIERAHGRIAEAGFAVLAYGSVGGGELGFDSDLDLVFLFDAGAEAQSDGARPLDAPRYYARLAQKLIGLLGTGTGAGRLYEVDMRLRPDGAKGLLVSSLESFADYQRHRAWTWEQQALVRARAVAGDPALCRAFADIREQTLRRPRELAALLSDVRAMRARMRGELDRSTALRFDLKQGEGGLVDLEFLLQAQVLARAAAHPDVCAESATPALIEALACSGAFTAEQAAALAEAHETLLARGLECTLDRRPRWAPEDAAVAQARAAVRAICAAKGLDFASLPAA